MEENVQLLRLDLNVKTKKYRCVLQGTVTQFVDTLAVAIADNECLVKLLETALTKAKNKEV